MLCRGCQQPLSQVFADLGSAPPSNAFLETPQRFETERYYPLKVYVCDHCFLVQADEVAKASAIFKDDYVYFSSYSKTWVEHCRQFADQVIEAHHFSPNARIVEIASNDGCLLQPFLERGFRVLGIEPSGNTARVARAKGIDTRIAYFGSDVANALAQAGECGDLVIGNNVLAHVPNLHDFLTGLRVVLKPHGILSLEFPHLVNLIADRQFDTIYHEHYSYFSLSSLDRLLSSHGLAVFDVEQIATHGGSLRVYACHQGSRPRQPQVEEVLADERAFGILDINTYRHFQRDIEQVRDQFRGFLETQKRGGAKIVGYGAAAKGNTLLNFCGVTEDLISYVVDISPHKQGKYLPGSHLPVLSENQLREDQPDFVVIFPWNLTHEITRQLQYVQEWCGRFVTTIPSLKILS